MKRYIVNRLLATVVTLFMVTVVVFLLLRIIPGDPVMLRLGGEAGGSFKLGPEEIAALRREWGLDRPLVVQYASWIGGLLKLDAGNSFVSGRPVLSEIVSRAPTSAELAVMTVLISLLFAIPLGIVSAARQNTRFDYVARFISVLGLTMPIFWTGTLLILGTSILFRWVPPVSYRNIWEAPMENLEQMIWPALVMGFYHTTVLTRMTRSSMLEVLRQDYVRTAWAKGLREWVILRAHALKNALLPVLTLAGMQFGALMGGVVVLEQIFAVPGVGRLLVDAITHRDYPVVEATLVLFAMVVAINNLVVDLAYGWLDPRIRYT